MEQKKKILAVFLLGIAVLLIGSYYGAKLGAKSSGEAEAVNTNGITDTEIVIGSSSAQSGHTGFLGTQYIRGSLAYISKINDEGGIYGRKIRLVAYDDQYDPSKAVANTQKLILEDRAFILFDYVGTPTTMRAIGLINEVKIPLLGLFTGAEEFRNPVNPYIFNVRASYYDETGVAVDYFVGKKGLKKIAVFYQDDAFGQTGLKGTEIAMKRYGLLPVAKAAYARGTTAIEPAIQAIGSANPEAIVMIGTYTPLAKFVNAYRKEGYDPEFHTVSFVGAEAFAKELSGYGINSSEKIIVTQVVPDPHEASGEYLALTVKYFPETDVSYVGLEGYANAVLLVKVLNNAGKDINRKKFIDALESVREQEIIGIPATLGKSDHQAFDSVYLSNLDKGRFEMFDPWVNNQ